MKVYLVRPFFPLYIINKNFIMKVKEYIRIFNSGSVEEKIQAGIIDIDILYPEGCDNVKWNNISKYQKLSEEFIEKHKDKLNWDKISEYQKLREPFIEKYKD